MDTFFASPERLSGFELKREIEFVSSNPIIDGLLHSVSGLLAVLNEHRQILAVNQSLLTMLQVGDAEKVLGLRPGEVLGCIYAHEMPAGCGTSKYCSTCGAAISIVTSLAKNTSVEKECALSVDKDGQEKDLYLRVRCVPVTFESRRFLLLFLQDLTYQQRLATLEKVFFHDINGIVSGLMGASELLCLECDEKVSELSQTIHRLALRLASEIAIQRSLNLSETYSYLPVFSSIALAQVVQEIKDIYRNNPVAKNKTLVLPEKETNVLIKTEPSLLLRVLKNMVTNALEGTEEGGQVKLWVEESQKRIAFCVQNKKAIPSDIAKRVFQRNFSTKAAMGRGLGTYSMKLFGEDILGGTVNFTSSEEEGTVFRFSLEV